MKYTIEIEQETDGRYIAEILELSGVLVYGDTQEQAINKVQALALRVLADKLENEEITTHLFQLSFSAS
jgi:predicted RNase H-like HicB family nuclease